MSGEYISGNYDLAKAEADKVDAQIIETLKSGHSFRVEAGAGSGKTYSLNRVIEWIQANKRSDYSRKKQNVVCITYTNAAVDVIAERLAKDSFILPSTIHSFAWNGPGGKFCVSVFRQNQEYHVFNVHDGGLFPLVTSLPEGWDGMRADTA